MIGFSAGAHVAGCFGLKEIGYGRSYAGDEMTNWLLSHKVEKACREGKYAEQSWASGK